MARPLRCQFPGALYHITARGNARATIFHGSYDYEAFLELVEIVVGRYSWCCHAYCLMGNHYHLLVETREATLCAGMRHLNGLYAQGFNRRHGREGHVFQGRFKAILVEGEGHLLRLARYIFRNPVRARLCVRPADWPWSSYRAMLGAPFPSCLTTSWLLECFGRDEVRARAALRRFVECEGEEDPWRELRGELFLGSDRFAMEAAAGSHSREVPRRQRQPVRPSLGELLTTGCGEEIALAHQDYGFRLNEIAAQLGIHYATAGRRLRAWEEGRRMLQRKT
jgi:putative transposase